MKRLLTMLVASLALVLAAGVGTAWAGGLPGGDLPAGQSQTIDQSQNATNSIDQTANAQSVAVNASPNVAIANSGSVDQSSNASSGAAAVNQNDSQQSNNESNDAEQSQGGALADDNNHESCCKRTSKQPGQSQETNQNQTASNSISQDARANSAAVNASPNVAVLNSGGCGCNGGVQQSSNASSGAVALNKNQSEQNNTLQNDADQSQAGGRGESHGKGGDPSQSISQDQTASNSIDQTARAHSFALNASPNVAVLNSGPVDQSSNASSGAVAVNKNQSEQSNTLQNEADQSQAGGNHHSKCCGSESQSQDVRQDQNASNSISQNAESKSVAVNASPNVAVLNSGAVDQSSNAESKAVAVNDNRSSQSNELNQEAEQQQEGGCAEQRCKPERCCDNACEERSCD